MRQKRTVQSSIFERYVEHEIGSELQAMSAWLDDHPEMFEWIATDLESPAVRATGRLGLSCESVLRCAVLKQYRQLSYEDLAFCLLDSVCCQSFARLSTGWVPKKSALQAAISAISAATWERINQCLLRSAQKSKVEGGQMLRIDSTVTASAIHKPTDSSLLRDCVRLITRLLGEADEVADGVVSVPYCNHQRAAKKRVQAIQFGRGAAKRKRSYRELLEITQRSLGYLDRAVGILHPIRSQLGSDFDRWLSRVAHFKPLIERVLDQTRRRIIEGEKVSSEDKIVSLFEDHTDIIVKGSRDVQYGHKLNLCSGRSGLILDAVIEEGNPGDADRLLPMLDRHIAHYGRAPRQMAADGGYASIQNLKQAKARQVSDVVFHKKRGLQIEAMARSRWVYRKLRNFRAGIEAGISCLKRAYGLDRCTWKGLDRFKAYVWSSVVAHNLALFARLKPS